MPSVIDTHPDRQNIINAMLSGDSDRKVGRLVGISGTAVAKYRRAKLIPALQAAAEMNKIQRLRDDERLEPQTIAQSAELASRALEAQPWVDRITKRYEQFDALAPDSVKAKDFRGFSAMVGSEARIMELHAKLTGHLETAPSSNGPQVVVVINNNAAPAAAEDLQINGAITIDTRAEK